MHCVSFDLIFDIFELEFMVAGPLGSRAGGAAASVQKIHLEPQREHTACRNVTWLPSTSSPAGKRRCRRAQRCSGGPRV